MGMPAARLNDMHVCPMVTVLVPHVGGPIVGPGCPTVLIGGMPAACVGDIVTCAGPPDAIVMGSFTVMFGGRPAAQLGSLTAHGGTVVMGYPMVLVG
ncbi:PAAR domain-containing protein [Reyranella massiliensis]|uniref:PAAR domain-containing protein n=1 Tax=Reyranella massiliensis TaxID=445220 RepID=UPI000305C698|nr:PAAR domain-containing protein [Reyranella massiliensis]